MKKRNIFGMEEGFWSSFVFLFLVTLGLLGMGAYALLKSEGGNVANEMKIMQSNTTLEAAAYYGLMALKKSAFVKQTELDPLSIGGVNVTLDTSEIGTDVLLRITAAGDNVSRQLQIQLQMGVSLVNKAIVTLGDINDNVTVVDSLGNPDPERLIESADSIPTVKLDSLKNMANSQGHKKTGNWTATNNYPSASFFRPDGITPNVSWVTGTLTLSGTNNIYGIWIVEGNVNISGTAKIYGILYLPNATSTLINSSTTPSVVGGIVSDGNISGSGGNVKVMEKPTYMNAFCKFLKYGTKIRNQIVRWIYL